ncbi:MAG: DUF996 domain-containing protein [Thermoplasmata archaeon]|nr:DUF996 domain-containing protein [Thermoplasmata archaeon]
MNLSQAKVYGGIGAILSLIGGVVPYAGGVLAIIGVILILIAVKKISDETRDEAIFKNYFISFIMGLVAIAVTIVSFIAIIGMDVFFHVDKLEEFLKAHSLVHLIAALIIAFIVLWIFEIVSAVFLKNSYYAIAEYTKVDLFRTTGLLYFIGALTLIVLIGFLILLIAKILEIIAYFSLPERMEVEETMK